MGIFAAAISPPEDYSALYQIPTDVLVLPVWSASE
jgi:hypothetical protein